MTPKDTITKITKWIKTYATKNKIETLVVGISGGIDSSVVSTLCAQTGLPTIVVQMPIRQNKKLDNLSSAHGAWLTDRYPNVTYMNMDLDQVFDSFEKTVGPFCSSEQEPNPQEQLAFANSRARLRMMTLYAVAQSHNGIVVGTGNKVEDFGVGFFTKYGDGGVDISPIGDCFKTRVWGMGDELGLLPEIVKAVPTDGLWEDGRSDEDQLGMSYRDLEYAMQISRVTNGGLPTGGPLRKIVKQYQEIRAQNMHKMKPIPVCKLG
tara:strand:- start:467 stop:1258 length:792 start_codon:yes stop_codon:yes gene_type:complete